MISNKAEDEAYSQWRAEQRWKKKWEALGAVFPEPKPSPFFDMIFDINPKDTPFGKGIDDGE